MTIDGAPQPGASAQAILAAQGAGHEHHAGALLLHQAPRLLEGAGPQHRQAVGLAAALPGCPDTERPALSPRSATRVCTAEELSEFRLASTADVRHDLWVAFVDVGQGDATWIRTPGTLGVDAKEILIDAGDCQLDKPFPGGDGVGECGIRYTGPSDGQVDGVGALIDFMLFFWLQALAAIATTTLVVNWTKQRPSA